MKLKTSTPEAKLSFDLSTKKIINDQNDRYFDREISWLSFNERVLLQVYDKISLKNPALNWVSISKGMGVDAVQVDNIEDLVKYFKHGLREKGPFLIEVLI